VRLRKALAIPATLAVILVLAVSSSLADTRMVKDPDDAAGRLDVKSLIHGHAQGGRVLVHRLGTYHNWRGRRLKGDNSHIYLWFTTDREKRYAEKRVVIDFKKGRLKAWLQTYQETSDSAVVGPLRRIEVKRLNRHSVTVLFMRRALVGKGQGRYGWYASTSLRSPRSHNCNTRTCTDSAPQGTGTGRITHKF
jgi:hypothetical protein